MVYADFNTEYSLHRCMLLPVLGQLDGKDPFSIYQRIERYLKESNWCYYRSNSNVLTMLQSYRQNLAFHLENPKVLREVAAKTQSGSLIKIVVNTVIGGVKLSVKVMGDNGEDIFFSEKKLLEEGRVDTIFPVVIDWLETYGKTIPYDGRILTVSEGKFTIDIGSASRVFPGNKLRVERPIEKRSHPLLNEIVDWKTQSIGKGKITNVLRFRSNVEATKYSVQQPLLPKDWIVLEEDKVNQKIEETTRYPELRGHKFGQMGILSVGGKLGWGSDTVTIQTAFRGQRIAGLLIGAHMGGELWVTKNFLTSLELERNIGSYSRSREKGLDTIAMVQDMYKFKLGYRFLPLNLFFGPRVEIYLGHAVYNYNLDIVASEGFGHHSIRGLLLGIKGDIPFGKRFRGFMRLDFLPTASYSETTDIFGNNPKSVSSYQIEFGALYHYFDQAAFQGSLEITSNRAVFKGNTSFYFYELALKGGIVFAY